MTYSWYYSKTGYNVMYMLQKEDDDWVKKWMEYEVKGSRPRSRQKRTGTECKKTVKHVN